MLSGDVYVAFHEPKDSDQNGSVPVALNVIEETSIHVLLFVMVCVFPVSSVVSSVFCVIDQKSNFV